MILSPAEATPLVALLRCSGQEMTLVALTQVTLYMVVSPSRPYASGGQGYSFILSFVSIY